MRKFLVLFLYALGLAGMLVGLGLFFSTSFGWGSASTRLEIALVTGFILVCATGVIGIISIVSSIVSLAREKTMPP